MREHLDAMKARNLKSSTINTARLLLATILDTRRTEEKQLTTISPARAVELYTALVQGGYAVDSHRNALNAAKALDRHWLHRKHKNLNQDVCA